MIDWVMYSIKMASLVAAVLAVCFAVTRHWWITAIPLFLAGVEMATPTDSPWASLFSGRADVLYSLGGGVLFICCAAVLGLFIYREFDRWDRECAGEKAPSTHE